MKLTTALKSRTVWMGIIAALIAGLKLMWPENTFLDDLLQDKAQLASQFVLVVEGALGIGVIIFRIKAKARDE